MGYNYQKIDGWNSSGGDWQKSKGPMTSWVRVCSNGMGLPEVNKSGFILTNDKNFYQTYGFKASTSGGGNRQVIGYTPDGKEHNIFYDKNTSQFPINVPSPEIVKVETIIQKELFRRSWIHWTCFSSKQLEYMTPYFLVPRITCVIEFGWNFFNMDSLIDLTDTKKLKEYYFSNPYPLYNENILRSNGNYDVVFGLITNYEWSVEGNKINCVTEVTSKDRLYSGVSISTTVIEKQNPKDPNTQVKYYSNIRTICDTDFIKNLKSIASSPTIDDVPQTTSNEQLLQIIKGGKTSGRPVMKEEYWRGIFYGRDPINMAKSGELDFEWTIPKKSDFDNSLSDDEVWVNMGFIVELLNRTLPLPCVQKDVGFFEVSIDETVIGGHPNLISTDGSILLIPNALAPKYMWGLEGMKENGPGGDYDNQFGIPTKEATKNLKKFDVNNKDQNDPLWHANRQLTNVFGQGVHPTRDDIDWVINANRYIYYTGRDYYAFPFVNQQTFSIKNRTSSATYDPYFYGFLKDLYFNVKRFVSLIKDENIKTYTDLYRAIFDDINRAGGNFWDLSLVINDNTSQLTVVDNKMLPSGNNKSKPWYFDYADSDQLLMNLGFRPKMSDAQAFRVVFGETNNKDSKTTVKSDNSLLDYKFQDRLLVDNQDNSPTVIASSDANKDPFLKQVQTLQHFEPVEGSYQFTVMVGNKPYFRRLVLPDAQMLSCLLDDHDEEKNQRYTGIQPITVEVSIQGIGGLRTFMSFLIRNLPDPYNHKDVCYRIVDVHHIVQDGKWNTVIKAGIIPLRGYIKQKLGIPE